MKPCSDYQEMLLLDVYGELNPAERRAWENHLSTCEHCRKEKEQLVAITANNQNSPAYPNAFSG